MEERRGISFFDKYLTLWVILCMALGIGIGEYAPRIPAFLGKFEYSNVSIPIAALIWLMIYPMMMKVDFKSIIKVKENPKGLYITWVVNWLIKPFTMYAIASLFFSPLAGIGKQQHHEDGCKRIVEHHKLDVIIF